MQASSRTNARGAPLATLGLFAGSADEGRAAFVPAMAQRCFPPTRFAALRRAIDVEPQRYAGTRNHLEGAVTALSPYLTHGLIGADEAFALWRERYGLTLADKLMTQLAWRSFFRHVRSRWDDAILQDMRPSTLPDASYRPTLPADVVAACTGVRVIDETVKRLYADGWLHNHQRMWLASYCVHLRKVHWRAGADWMYGHLLDGDLASNHLSWQWVAGTFSTKPYLFNAENVARYAPELASPGTPLDTSYEHLAKIAADDIDVGPSSGGALPVDPPKLYPRPPGRVEVADFARLARGRRVALVHPWDLARRPDAECVIGVILLPFHARFPWSAARWNFVLDRMRALCDAVWVGSPAHLAILLDGCAQVRAVRPPEPDYAAALTALPLELREVPPALPAPHDDCSSFSAYFRHLRRTCPAWFSPIADSQRQH